MHELEAPTVKSHEYRLPKEKLLNVSSLSQGVSKIHGIRVLIKFSWVDREEKGT